MSRGGAAKLDCVVIGYNETPIAHYEGMVRRYGVDSEAYRDLMLSCVDLDGQKATYPGLINEALRRAGGGRPASEIRSGEIPNLAAAYLVHYLRRRGLGARYVNLFQDEKDRLRAYLDEDPVCVAITTTFYVWNFPVNEMVEFIRAHNPRTRIVVGGPLVANHARGHQGRELQAALDDMGADFYVHEGQGELTLYQLVQCLKDGGDVSRVPNLLYVEKGKLRATPRVPEANSLEESWIDWTAFADEDPGPTIQTRTARSCAFSCSFCNYPARAGKLTLAGLETVERELDSMRALGVRNAVFIDDTFNVPLPRFKDICRLMIRKGYGFDWFSYFRCSNSDEEAVELMAESGCKGVFLGIESGSPAILKGMNKAATPEKYLTGIEMLRRHGILTFGSFIVGFPGETDETVRETEDFLRAARPDYYRAQLWYCEPGTPIDLQREQYAIQGEGFVWQHRGMDSLAGMEHIERMFLSVEDSVWLPQWSYDFWIIPYLLGKGVTLEQFRTFMLRANKLMALDVASVPGRRKAELRNEGMAQVVDAVSEWKLS